MIRSVSNVLQELRFTGGRPLERPELELAAARIAAADELWRPHHDPAADQRTYASLHRDAVLDVWAIFWLPENDTGWHDHDTSSGAVHVIDGELEEHALLLRAPDRRRTHRAGGSFSFGPSQIHRLTCEVSHAISIHAYSPPLWRLGQYSVDAEGMLHRQSVSYADELRPLEGSAAA